MTGKKDVRPEVVDRIHKAMTKLNRGVMAKEDFDEALKGIREAEPDSTYEEGNAALGRWLGWER